MKKSPLRVIIFCLLLLLPEKLFGHNEIEDGFRINEAFRQYYLLQKYPKLVKTTKNGFTVFIENGKMLQLLNEPYEGGDSVTKYSLDQYFADIDFLGFTVGYYEASGYEMVNMKNGETFSLNAKPVISPDKNHLIVSGFNEMNGLDLAVYKISAGKIVEEKSFKDLSLGFHSWIDSQTVRMQEGSSIYEKDSISNKNLNWKNYLLYHDLTANDWILTETAEKFPPHAEDALDQELMKAYTESAKTYSDKKKALEAVKIDVGAIKFIPKKFYADKDIMKIVVSGEQGENLALSSDEIKNDEEIVKIAVTQGGTSLQFASEKLRDDKSVVEIAIKQDIHSFQFVSDRLKDDREILMQAATICKNLPRSEGNLSPRETECSKIFNNFPPRFASDKAFLLKVAEAINSIFTFETGFFNLISPQLKDDKEFMLKMIKIVRQNDLLLEDLFANISDRLKQDKEFIKRGIELSPRMYRVLNDDLKNDEEIFLISGAVFNVPYTIRYKLIHDKEYFWKFIKYYPGNKDELNRILHGIAFFPRSFIDDPNTNDLINKKRFNTQPIY